MLHKWVLFITSVSIMMSGYAFAEEKSVEAEPGQPKAGSKYAFSYFKGNGEDGLHLAWSDDGLSWTALNYDHSFLQPKVGGKFMRDPFICRGSDGMFHLVWTTGWWDKGIGIAHSKNLIDWSEQQWLNVMANEPNAMNCWAPEIFFDQDQQQYIIFWATTIPGRFPETDNTGDTGKGGFCNHRIYCVTTADFKTYSQPRLFYDNGFNVIDATIIKDGVQYVMFFKDETLRPNPKKNIRVAFANKAKGPYGSASQPISPDWVEGPTAIKIGDYWHLYFDAYTRGQYEGARSKDFLTWEPITEQLSFPKGARHGTIFTVPDEIVTELKKSTSVAFKTRTR